MPRATPKKRPAKPKTRWSKAEIDVMNKFVEEKNIEYFGLKLIRGDYDGPDGAWVKIVDSDGAVVYGIDRSHRVEYWPFRDEQLSFDKYGNTFSYMGWDLKHHLYKAINPEADEDKEDRSDI